MEKSGLILRRKNEQDKRNVDVELTEQGKTAAVEAIQNRQSYADELFGALPQRKKQQLAGLLDALLHHCNGICTFPIVSKSAGTLNPH